MDLYSTVSNLHIREGIKRTRYNLGRSVKANLERHGYLDDYSEEVRKAKLEVAQNYDYWIDRITEVLESNGAEVYFARNGEEAKKICGKIIGRGKVIVKAKSMISEEIGLREYLEQIGNEVWETDLGELIIQLANDRPMHVIAPALHYTKDQAARVLKKIGVSGKTPEELVRNVREVMREKFLIADAGISGCNAISAESGRVFLVENEGNIRLSTSLPKIYISLISVDKILPDDVLALKSILVQSAFLGTYPPSYINVNLPVRNQSFHAIIIDNGRIETELKEQLTCVKCGRCQLECPVFQLAGNVWGGSVYGGPMGIVWSAILGELRQEAFICTLCGKCKVVCPMKIDIPTYIREIRKKLLLGET